MGWLVVKCGQMRTSQLFVRDGCVRLVGRHLSSTASSLIQATGEGEFGCVMVMSRFVVDPQRQPAPNMVITPPYWAGSSLWVDTVALVLAKYANCAMCQMPSNIRIHSAARTYVHLVLSEFWLMCTTIACYLR